MGIRQLSVRNELRACGKDSARGGEGSANQIHEESFPNSDGADVLRVEAQISREAHPWVSPNGNSPKAEARHD
jgi:hypothetical protein